MRKPVNYDLVAPEYDRRYESNRFDGIRECLRMVLGGEVRSVLEVGCGTGHWLADIAPAEFETVIGLDQSHGMLHRAQTSAPAALLVQATAERLPFPDARLDRVFCVNALHHFTAPFAFVTECRRVLRDDGGLLTIGLDPHVGDDQWWVYEYFPSALEKDCRRYPATSAIRDLATAAGFREIATTIAQHIPAAVSFDQALSQGLVERSSTSQLMVISDDEYEAGRARLLTEKPMLRADLHLYASIAWA